MILHAAFVPSYHVFRDRLDAGRELAERLAPYRGTGALVLGIPRGGVPVAAEVARQLGADLGVVVARKLGAPYQEELAIGAVTADGGRYLNEDLVRELGVSESYIEAVTAKQRAEAQRRDRRFRGAGGPPPVAGRVVILVDDGLATGATVHAAIRSVREQGAARIIVAAPVGPAGTCDTLRAEADEVVCLHQPEPFYAVGLHYEDFRPTSDDEVERLLTEWAARR